MNRIRIEEGIVTKIQPSHKFGDIQYDMMGVIVKNSNGKILPKIGYFSEKFLFPAIYYQNHIVQYMLRY